jgi:hypothetical protein
LALALAHIAFSLKFLWPGVSSRLKASPSFSKLMLALDRRAIPAHSPPPAALFALDGELEIKASAQLNIRDLHFVLADA